MARRSRREGESGGANPAVPITVAMASEASSVARSLSVNVRSECAAARAWTVLRRKAAGGRACPIQLEWPEPVMAWWVWGWLLNQARGRDPEYRRYSHFEACPTDEQPPTEGGRA